MAVLVSAKAITLVGHAVPLSVWSPFAYLWQDVCLVLLFFLVDRALGRPAPAWVLYALLVIYAAINVPVTLVLSTPLTRSMMRGARGALADAVLHYLTAGNIVALAVPIVVAVALPLMLRRRHVAMPLWTTAAAVGIVAIGPFAASRVDTYGLHRNAVGAIVATSLPRMEPAPGAGDWRTSLSGQAPGEDLSSLRGSMKGRNVILVVLESTGARHLGAYGGVPDPTPNLTALARRSIVFERAYAVYPESIKALLATLCSRYPAFDLSLIHI